MTSFTITCPPTTVALQSGQSNLSRDSYTSGTNDADTVAFQSVSHSSTTSYLRDPSSNVFVTESGQHSYSDDFSIDGTLEASFTSSSSYSTIATYSWNGAFTVRWSSAQAADGSAGTSPTSSEIIATSYAQTSTQTTTTQTQETVFSSGSATFTASRQTGTVSSSSATTRTTQATITSSSNFSYTRTNAVTTTQETTFSAWRENSDAETTRGTYQSATVVILDNNQQGWQVTETFPYTTRLSSVADSFSDTLTTILPTFGTAAGQTLQATQATDSDSVTFWDLGTSSSLIETPTSYTVTTLQPTTVTVGSPANLTNAAAGFPTPTRTLTTQTIATSQTPATISAWEYTGVATTATTVDSSATFQDRIGNTTFHGIFNYSSTRKTSVDFLSGQSYSASSTDSFENTDENTSYEQEGSSEAATVVSAWTRALRVGADMQSGGQTPQFAAFGLFSAFAAPSALNSAGLRVGAAGMTVQNLARHDLAAQTAFVAKLTPPFQSWTYTTSGSTVAVSADAKGLSATSSFGPTSSIETQSTSGTWTTSGAAITTASTKSSHNIGGRPALGESMTVARTPGLYATTLGSVSGTTEITGPSTFIQATSAARTAVSALSVAAKNSNSPFVILARNITALPPA